jgi:2-haloacid dehalogenase
MKWLARTAITCLAAVMLCGSSAIGSNRDSRSAAADGAARKRFAAIAFDYFVLFNPDSVVAAVDRVFPGKGHAVTDIWRTRQFEYAWLRSIAGRYVDFSTITEDALVYAAGAVHVELTAVQRRDLMDAYLHLTPWPDTVDALRRLRQSGVRVITIANFSPAMLRANAEHAGLTTLFDALISTDANHTYKPDPRAYQLGVDHLRLAKPDVVFAAFGGWDAAGAKSFGYPTVWVNRFNQPAEELGVRPDRTVPDLKGLLDFVFESGPGPRAALYPADDLTSK